MTSTAEMEQEFKAFGRFFASIAKKDADRDDLEEYTKHAVAGAISWSLGNICEKLSSYEFSKRNSRASMQRQLRKQDIGGVGKRPLRSAMQDASAGHKDILRGDEARYDENLSDSANHRSVIGTPHFSVGCPHCGERIGIVKGNAKVNIGLVAAHFIIRHPNITEAWELLA